MPEPIKQEIQIDYKGEGLKESIKDQQKLKESVGEAGKSADSTSGKTEKLTKENVQLADSTRRAGVETDRTNESMTGLAGGLGGVKNAIGQKIAGWLSYIAIAGTIITTVREITAYIREQTKAVADLGKELRGLTANIGGKESAEVFRRVTEIAAENRLSPSGRAQLLEGVTSLTDAQPGLSIEQITEEARNLAKLQRATGVGGTAAQQVLQSAQQNLGLTSDQSVDFATAAINSGVTPEALEEIIARGGNVGGLDAVALLVGARETGLNVNKGGRSIPSLIAALTRRTPEGDLAPELAALGITEDQSFVQRLQFLEQQSSAGNISQGQFETAIGGAQNLRIVSPLVRALQTGAFERARQSLIDPNAAESTIAELQRNPYVRAQERQNLRDLYEQANKEFLTPAGELLAQGQAEFPQSGTVRNLTALGRLPEFMTADESQAEEYATINQRRIGDLVGRAVDDAMQGRTSGGRELRPGATVNINVNNTTMGQVYNLANQDGTTHKTEMTGRADLP